MSGLWTVLLTLAYCLPALALVVLLLTRRYPGEEVLARRLRRGRRARAPARAASDPPTRHRLARVTAATGGQLLATSLAGRAPPGL